MNAIKHSPGPWIVEKIGPNSANRVLGQNGNGGSFLIAELNGLGFPAQRDSNARPI